MELAAFSQRELGKCKAPKVIKQNVREKR